MKHYEITLANGGYPMTYKCSTIAEAYGCLEFLASWVPGLVLDLEGVMEMLVDMKKGKTLSHSTHLYGITVQDGEV